MERLSVTNWNTPVLFLSVSDVNEKLIWYQFLCLVQKSVLFMESTKGHIHHKKESTYDIWNLLSSRALSASLSSSSSIRSPMAATYKYPPPVKISYISSLFKIPKSCRVSCSFDMSNYYNDIYCTINFAQLPPPSSTLVKSKTRMLFNLFFCKSHFISCSSHLLNSRLCW